MEKLTSADLEHLSERIAFNEDTTIQEDADLWEIEGDAFARALQHWVYTMMARIAANPTPKNIELELGGFGYCMFQLGYLCSLEVEMRRRQDES